MGNCSPFVEFWQADEDIYWHSAFPKETATRSKPVRFDEQFPWIAINVEIARKKRGNEFTVEAFTI
jgi:hypothetical protein